MIESFFARKMIGIGMFRKAVFVLFEACITKNLPYCHTSPYGTLTYPITFHPVPSKTPLWTMYCTKNGLINFCLKLIHIHITWLVFRSYVGTLSNFERFGRWRFLCGAIFLLSYMSIHSCILSFPFHFIHSVIKSFLDPFFLSIFSCFHFLSLLSLFKFHSPQRCFSPVLAPLRILRRT